MTRSVRVRVRRRPLWPPNWSSKTLARALLRNQSYVSTCSRPSAGAPPRPGGVHACGVRVLLPVPVLPRAHCMWMACWFGTIPGVTRLGKPVLQCAVFGAPTPRRHFHKEPR